MRFFADLSGWQAGSGVSRLRALAVAVILAGSPAITLVAQDQPAAQPAAQQPAATKPAPAAETKAPESTDGKTIGGYQVHSMVDIGGRFADRSGSAAMWSTLVNQTTGARVLGQELQMHSVDPHKTPFFDTLTSSSFGYGGDPYDATYLNLSKGKWYDFAGSFRRDRQYFDYNLLVNSLLGPNQLIPQPSSLHLFNTVRRNTDTLLTILPVSIVDFRAGYNHNTHEGPSYSTIHQGGDVHEYQWFRNAVDTYVAGVDFKPIKRTSFSYDQFLVYYRGDTSLVLAPTGLVLPDSTPASVGVNLLTTSTCGTSGTANFSKAIVNGVINPFCSGTTTQNVSPPTRTSFPTEQFRFASSYWEKVAMNGRFVYSGATSNVKSFNETFIGLNSRTLIREMVDTGGLPGGRLASNKRINVNGDYSIRAEISPVVELSDVVNYWDVRIPGNTAWNELTLKGVATTGKPPNVKYGTSMLTPLTDPSLTPATTFNTDSGYLAQKNTGNTVLATFTATPQVKLTGGWRFNDREIKFGTDPNLTWHQNWLLVGTVVQPSSMIRVNVNYDFMHSSSSNSTTTPANTYTREAPDRIANLRGRVMVKPASWINFAISGNSYYADNTDPLVNHKEHNNAIGFTSQIIPNEKFNMELDYSYDEVYSVTNLCYTASILPPGATTGSNTCSYSADGNSYLGNGLYDAPMNYFYGMFHYTPNKHVSGGAGVRVNSTNGSAEFLSPYMVPGALQSKYWSPYADLVINIAPNWSWHGDWNRPEYTESGPAGPAPRDVNGNIFTLGVKYAF
ncbi:MAG TPA: hypothetical protein VKB38_12040 [Terracidiphilus sp.]|nr:hypothetical protein [Terracidiphilus sp.]